MLGTKILIADDEDYILRVVALKLTGAGYRVVTASCGATALSAARLDRPDLVITDLQMPRLTGLELCQTLHDEAVRDGQKQIPSILLTARAHDLERSQAQPPPNLKRVISKPFSPRQLVLAVKELLEEAA